MKKMAQFSQYLHYGPEKKTRKNSYQIVHFPTNKEVCEVSKQAKKWAVLVNLRTDEQMAQYLCQDCLLFWPTVHFLFVSQIESQSSWLRRFQLEATVSRKRKWHEIMILIVGSYRWRKEPGANEDIHATCPQFLTFYAKDIKSWFDSVRPCWHLAWVQIPQRTKEKNRERSQGNKPLAWYSGM